MIKAYQELKADGLVDSHVGKGTIVLSQVFEQQANAGYISPLPWYQFYSESVTASTGHIIGDIMETAMGGDVISFAGGMPSPDLYPIEQMQEIQRELFKRCAG